jgi:ABC-type sugar transport system substrate-binding protein
MLNKALFGSLIAAFATLAAPALVQAEDQDRYLGITDPVQDKAPVLRYGVTLVHLQDDFWKGMAYGIVDEVKRVGGKVVQISIAGKFGNMAEQYAQIEAMMAKGIDVLVLGPSSFDGFDPMLQKVRAKGIKIIAAGIPLNSKVVDFGVVMSDYQIGKALGDDLCANRPKDKPTFKTLALPGPPGAEWTRLRVDGLTESAKNCPGEDLVVAPVGGEISLGYGLTTTADLITKHPDASFVWTPTMGLGMGAIQAVKQRHANMKVVGSTIVRGIFPEFDNGTLLGDNTEPAILMGRLMVQYSIRQKLNLPTPLIKEDKNFPYPVVVTPTRIINSANYKAYPWEETDVPPADWSIEAFQ